MSRPAQILTRTLAVLALCVTVILPFAVGATPASAYPDTNLVLTGHGYGHGRGMGQWGAFGYATKANLKWDWHQILDHYYGGTHLDSATDAEIGVRLTAEDGTDLTVTSGSPFTADGASMPAGTAVRYSMNGQGQIFKAIAPGGCGTTETFGGQVTDATFVPSITSSDDLATMLTVCQPNGTRTYRGSLRMVNDNGTARTVNVVRMEQYLLGVIPRESPSSWGDVAGGMNALEAQAVAARSYAWAESRYSYAKTCDSESCQVYGGAGQNGQKLETANATNARNQTWQAVLRMDSNSAIARAEFSSSTGGYTAGGTFPAVVDEGDDVSGNPNHSWTVNIPAATIESAYQLGTLQSVTVTKRNGLGPDGGRVLNVTFTGTTRTLDRTGDQVRVDFALRSNWFSVTPPVGNGGGGGGTTTTTQPPVPAGHQWIIPATMPPGTSALTRFGFGNGKDVVLACDWNGDGVDTPGTFNDGTWTISNTQSNAPSGLYTFTYGMAGDTPICGDWNGDGVDTIGVFRKGQFLLTNKNGPGPVQGAFRFGNPDDQPIVGDWNGDHVDTPGIHRGDRFYFSNTLATNMKVDSTYAYGNPGDNGVLIGDWDRNGADEPAIHRGDRFYAGDGKGGLLTTFPFGGPDDLGIAGRFVAGGPDVLGVVRG